MCKNLEGMGLILGTILYMCTVDEGSSISNILLMFIVAYRLHYWTVLNRAIHCRY